MAGPSKPQTVRKERGMKIVPKDLTTKKLSGLKTPSAIIDQAIIGSLKTLVNQKKKDIKPTADLITKCRDRKIILKDDNRTILDIFKEELLNAEIFNKAKFVKRRYQTIEPIRRRAGIKELVRKVIKPPYCDIFAHNIYKYSPKVQYFTHGHKLDFVRDICKESNPYIPTTHTLGTGRQLLDLKLKQRKFPHYLSDTISSSQNRDILNRLYTPFEEQEVEAKLDIVPDFWKIVEGRKLKFSNEKNKTKYYLDDTLKKKLTASFLREYYPICEFRYILLPKQVPAIKNEFKHVETFHNFLDEVFCESVEIQEMSEELMIIKCHIISYNKKLQALLDSIFSDLSDVYERGRCIKWCKNLLHKLSPNRWKEIYRHEKEIYESPYVEKVKKIVDEYVPHIMKFETRDERVEMSINQLAEHVLNLGPPMLYFKEPQKLYKLLKSSKLDYLENEIKCNSKLVEIKLSIRNAEEKMQTNLTCINNFKEELNKVYNKYKKQNFELEQKINEYINESPHKLIKFDLGKAKDLIKNILEPIDNPPDDDYIINYLNQFTKEFLKKFVYIQTKHITEEIINNALSKYSPPCKQVVIKPLNHVEAYYHFVIQLIQKFKKLVLPKITEIKFKPLNYRTNPYVEKVEKIKIESEQPEESEGCVEDEEEDDDAANQQYKSNIWPLRFLEFNESSAISTKSEENIEKLVDQELNRYSLSISGSTESVESLAYDPRDNLDWMVENDDEDNIDSGTYDVWMLENFQDDMNSHDIFTKYINKA